MYTPRGIIGRPAPYMYIPGSPATAARSTAGENPHHDMQPNPSTLPDIVQTRKWSSEKQHVPPAARLATATASGYARTLTLRDSGQTFFLSFPIMHDMLQMIITCTVLYPEYTVYSFSWEDIATTLITSTMNKGTHFGFRMRRWPQATAVFT